MTNQNKKEQGWEKIETAGKRVHLLLYGGERENDPQYTEWRADLESAILDWIDVWKEQAREELIAEQVKAIKKLSKTWKPCKRKNCDNKEECERANHYIETIWNPAFEKVLSILKEKR